MSSGDVDPVRYYAGRMGLMGSGGDGDSESKRLLQLARNHLRRLKTSPAAAAMGLSASCQAVMALHLAHEAGAAAAPVDAAAAAALAGFRGGAGAKKSKYLNSLGNLRDALGLGSARALSLEDCAARLGCPQLRAEAAKILARYAKENKSVSREDAARPVFLCSALAAAGSAAKPRVRVDRARLLELSGGASKKVLEDLTKAMIAAAAAKEDKDKKRRKSGKVAAPEDDDDDMSSRVEARASEDGGNSASKTRKINPTSAEEDPHLERDAFDFDREEYERWKAGILREAGIA